MNVFPLWTRKVIVTKSGVIVERRDQVLIGSCAPVALSLATLAASFASTNGPFLSDRLMAYLLPSRILVLARAAEPDDEALRGLLAAAGLAALGELAALPVAGLAAHAASAVSSAAGVGDGVHRLAPDGGANAQPALATGLPQNDVRPVRVAHLADGRPAADMQLADLAAGQNDVGVVSFFGHQLGEGPGAPGELAALPRGEFDVVDELARRDAL